MWCRVTVMDGRAVARYRWAGLDVDGSESIDENVSDWSDDDIRETVATMIGADSEQARKIEVER